MASKHKVVLIGLTSILKIEDYLMNEHNDFTFLCDEYRDRSIVSFCVNGKFLDEL